MNTILKHIKEIGIILSYIGLLLACYIFDWKPFAIFISYLLEIVVLLLIYALLRYRDQRKNPSRYRKLQPIQNLFIGILPIIFVQFFVIMLMVHFISPDENPISRNFLFTKEVYYAFGSIVILYSLQALQISDPKERLAVFQENFLLKVLALTSANLLGLLLVINIERMSLLVVLTVMVSVRIALEIYFSRKMKLV